VAQNVKQQEPEMPRTAQPPPAVAAKKPPPELDSEVVPAAASLPAPAEPVNELLLPADEVVRIEQLDLKPHMLVRGRSARRPMVSVPRRGLVVDCDDVTFEGIDFIWSTPAERSGSELSPAAMIVVRAPTASFRGCSFSIAGDAAPPAAVAWIGAAETLPGFGGRLALADCVAAGTQCLVDSQATGGLAVALDNVLGVHAGPLIRLRRAPEAAESIELALDHVTTRGACSVLECRYGRLPDSPGPIQITANDSALAGSARHGLVVLVGARAPDRLARSIVWNGQGSIVTPETPMLLWRAPAGHEQIVPEEELQVGGLVRSDLEFAGPPDASPAASRIVRWRVPLRSPDPPGAEPNSLALPRR
jgi:hypothetical protein